MAQGHPATVLIVDDEPDIRRVIRLFLQRDDRFEVAGEAGDGAEGTELARSLQPDVILLDLMMPRVSGRDALPRIAKDAPRSMIVVLSALDPGVEEEPALALGAFAYLEKKILDTGFADRLAEQHDQFLRALDGETIVAPSAHTHDALRRRAHQDQEHEP